MFAEVHVSRELAKLRRRQPTYTKRREHTESPAVQLHRRHAVVAKPHEFGAIRNTEQAFTYGALHAARGTDDREAQEAQRNGMEVAIELPAENNDGIVKLCVILERGVLGATTVDGIKY